MIHMDDVDYIMKKIANLRIRIEENAPNYSNKIFVRAKRKNKEKHIGREIIFNPQQIQRLGTYNDNHKT